MHNVLQVTLPVPANPIKLAKLAASRAAKQAKNNKMVMQLMDDDVKPRTSGQQGRGRAQDSASVRSSQPPTDTAQETKQEEQANSEEKKQQQRRWYMGEYGTSEGKHKAPTTGIADN